MTRDDDDRCDVPPVRPEDYTTEARRQILAALPYLTPEERTRITRNLADEVRSYALTMARTEWAGADYSG